VVRGGFWRQLEVSFGGDNGVKGWLGGGANLSRVASLGRLELVELARVDFGGNEWPRSWLLAKLS